MALPPGVTQAEADAALDEAAASGQTRHPVVDVRADWSRTGRFDHPLAGLDRFAVQEITVTREIAGELPAEAGMVEGVAAAATQVVLGPQRDPDTGQVEDGTDPVRVFAPYDVGAPLFGTQTIGAPLEVDLGLDSAVGPQTRTRFQGTVSRVERDSDPANRTVTASGLDGANQMRAPITQPPMGMDSLILARWGSKRYSSRINSQWLIDRIFRANGWYASPPPQPGAFISATMHGSAVPEIGDGGVPIQFKYFNPDGPPDFVNTGHPHGMLYPNSPAMAQTGVWNGAEGLTMYPGEEFGCSFLLRAPTRPAFRFLMGARLDGGPFDLANNMYAIAVYIYYGAPALAVFTPAGGAQVLYDPTWQLPSSPEWRHVGLHWSFGDGTCTLRTARNGVVTGRLTVPISINPESRMWLWAPTVTMEYELAACLTNISWFKGPYPEEWVGPGWQSMCDIDPGLNELTGMPQLDGEESWPLAVEVAAAEYAQIGFTSGADGRTSRPYFRSRAVAREQGTPRVVTAHRDLADLVATSDEATVRNAITSSVTPLLTGDWEPVFVASEHDQFECGPGATPFTIPLPADCVEVAPRLSAQLNQAGYKNSWAFYRDRPDWRYVLMYCVVYSARPTLPVAPGLVAVRLFRESRGAIRMIVYNRTRFGIRFATEDVVTRDANGVVTSEQPGEPALRIPGRLLKAAATIPSTIHDPGSVDTFGLRTLELGGGGSGSGTAGGSRWHQHLAATRGIKEAVLPATAYPVPLLDAVTAPMDPRTELGDLFAVQDPGGLGSVVGSAVSLTQKVSASAPATDEMVVRPLAPPGFGRLDHDGIGTGLRFGA